MGKKRTDRGRGREYSVNTSRGRASMEGKRENSDIPRSEDTLHEAAGGERDPPGDPRIASNARLCLS